jgi:hypothetical protein
MDSVECVQNNIRKNKTYGQLFFNIKTLKLKSAACFHKAVITGHPTVKQLCAISDKTYVTSASSDEAGRQTQT